MQPIVWRAVSPTFGPFCGSVTMRISQNAHAERYDSPIAPIAYLMLPVLLGSISRQATIHARSRFARCGPQAVSCHYGDELCQSLALYHRPTTILSCRATVLCQGSLQPAIIACTNKLGPHQTNASASIITSQSAQGRRGFLRAGGWFGTTVISRHRESPGRSRQGIAGCLTGPGMANRVRHASGCGPVAIMAHANEIAAKPRLKSTDQTFIFARMMTPQLSW